MTRLCFSNLKENSNSVTKKRSFSCCRSLFFSLLTLVICSSSYAESNETEKQKAFTLVTQAREHFQSENYQKAIQLWRQAYDTYQDNKLLFYIASTYSNIPKACQEEDQAWTAYQTACKESVCSNSESAIKRFKAFQERCYVTVKIDSATPKASVTHQSQEWGPLPHERSLLVGQDQKVKISAPGYLSTWIEIKLSGSVVQKTLQYKVNLTQIPKETFFEQHQQKFALTTTVIGVSLIAVGSLQLNSASSLGDEVANREYPLSFKNEAERAAFFAEYKADQEQFKSKQLWGSTFLTIGLGALGAGLWMLFYEGPNTALFKQARQQGDLAQKQEHNKVKTSSTWLLQPMSSPRSTIDGVQGLWRFSF